MGANAYPFHLELTPLAPPSVQLVPAKQYHGAPIGTSYDVRAYIGKLLFHITSTKSENPLLDMVSVYKERFGLFSYYLDNVFTYIRSHLIF